MYVNAKVLNRLGKTCLLTCALYLLFCLCQAASGGERVVLKNGLTVLMHPIAGIDRVGVEAFYDVGFVHEPKRMTQAAHLLEHLVCHGSSASFKQREAMQQLNAIGMANAETLPACTHYDYILPADKLALALRIEKERLTSLTFDQRLIQSEAGRCYQETDFVEANPASGMMKHAFMAFCQAWRHDAKQALVRGGLEDMQVAELRAFHRDFYRPDKLTLVIVGDFKLAEARQLIDDNLGTIKLAQTKPHAPISWAKVPKRLSIQWDAKVRGVCLAFPPPTDRASAAAISLYGTLILQQLASDAEIKRVADMAFCTNFTWKADPLPFFVYATAKDGQSLTDVELVLKARFKALSANAKSTTAQIPLFVMQLQSQTKSLNRQTVEQQAQMMKKLRGMDQGRAVGMVVTQAALNWAMIDRLLGPEPDKTAARIKSLVGPKLNRLIDNTLDEKHMLVTYVRPSE